MFIYRHTSATVRVWSSENNLRGSLFPFRDVGPRMNSGQEQERSHLASPHLVIRHKVSHGLVLTGLAGNPGDSPVSTSPVLALIQSMCHHTQLLVCRSWESNSCLHACKVSILATELTPQSYNNLFFNHHYEITEQSVENTRQKPMNTYHC